MSYHIFLIIAIVIMAVGSVMIVADNDFGLLIGVIGFLVLLYAYFFHQFNAIQDVWLPVKNIAYDLFKMAATIRY